MPSPLRVIYTGGTLGMESGPQGLAPGRDFEARLRRALETLPPARRASLPDFVFEATPEPIDSSAATPADWQALGRRLAECHDQAGGLVVLHGTDTLAWTASSLAYQLQGIARPVVVSGAMQPLEAPGSDALGNVEAALRFAARAELQEVAIAFAGKLLRGVRSRKWHTRDAEAFISPNYPLLGELVEGEPVFYPGRGLDEQQRGAPRFELADYRALGDAPVVRLTLWPGIQARQVAAWLEAPGVKGALLEVWGGGNVPSDPALLEVLAEASGRGQLLVAISQCPFGAIEIGSYAAGQGLVDAGVLSGDDMTPEAALTKLVHLLAQPLDEAQRRERFRSPLVGER
ncbi:asparaginase [Halomonas pacifica]|uniref:Asparaginase n=1 Tax=Bisbaumannia pacifica TaxID=77098 RepID=A0A510X550_9GAMM|nr:asparaginase [Halomonas pacifica]MBH8578671.1 asparaginase [Halomonas pacifica]MDC8803737.1 asparaginase [Halomonas pacifica]GEK46091.1 L-asparaginase 1 [Halomonas pacifica]